MHQACNESKPLGKHIERYVELTLSNMVSTSNFFYFEAVIKCMGLQVNVGCIIMDDSGSMIQITPAAKTWIKCY
jgi:hypothetical protein